MKNRTELTLIEKVEKFIIKKHLIDYGDRIVIGVSGGPDSLCLLYILNSLKKKYNLTLFIVHINHCLREQADFEEKFVQKTARQLCLEFFSKKADIKKLANEKKMSDEEIARTVRYKFFEEISEKVNANKIAVAHNANDNAETILMNIIRGCGHEGMVGIKEFTGKIIRPLLNTNRREIEKYCEDSLLTPMIDKTNSEPIYRRNKIRNELIPYIENINPDFTVAVNRLGDIFEEEEEFIKEYINKVYQETILKTEGKVIIDKNKFMQLKVGEKRRILRQAICDFHGNLKDVSYSTIDNAISSIETSKNGNIIKIIEGVKIFVNYEQLELFNNKKEKEGFWYQVNIPGRTYINELDKWIETKIVNAIDAPDFIKDSNKKVFDIAKTGKKLYVRNRKFGDYFRPTGMKGTKKLKDFFSDNKTQTYLRDLIPILTNETDIIWIMGMRASREFLKDETTKEVIIINYGENI